jgi:undecaprenyl-diphosphatase
MNLSSILILGLTQGVTELLPVSSSAHVILAGKFLGFDPTTPEGVLVLLALHSGTMCAVLIHYWKRWIANVQTFGALNFFLCIFVATAFTGVVGLSLKWIIEQVWLSGTGARGAEIESLFASTPLIATSLMATAILIALSARAAKEVSRLRDLSTINALWIGATQGLCLPFRGFSRSGATISVGLLLKLDRAVAETFSFALAIVLTPPLIFREWHHLGKASHAPVHLSHLLTHASLGFCVSFVSGFLALKWLSSWVDQGRWGYFAYYCAAMSLVVFALYFSGGLR